jgi:hypothetical protein
MHPAAPGEIEASRGRPAVKTGGSKTDDDIVTSVAYMPDDGAEPVSPELALVDPTLAARLRADLADPEPEPQRAMPPVEPEAEPTPVPDVVTPAADALGEEKPVADAPERGEASIHVLRPAPPLDETEVLPDPVEPEALPPRLVGLAAPPEPEPRPVVPSERAVPVARLPVIPAPPSRVRRPSSVSPLRRRSRFWQLLVLLATIVLFAGVVTVGVVVVSELRGGSVSPTTAEPSAPPVAGAPQPGDETGEPSATPAPSDDGGTAAAPRRFAWAPVGGAVAYRFELFRGDEQVLRATTPDPVYELPTTWRHEGREERLTSGSYRWYVWPVLVSGPADAAVVQADLDVP